LPISLAESRDRSEFECGPSAKPHLRSRRATASDQTAPVDPRLQKQALESAKHFAHGGPLYGQEISAADMRRRLESLR
jgi:hypothetical protein